MIPSVEDDMEGCPDDSVNLVYMILSAVLGVILFVIYDVIRKLVQKSKTEKVTKKQQQLKDHEFADLQIELFGSEVLFKDSLANTEHSRRSRGSNRSTNDHPEMVKKETSITVQDSMNEENV